MCIIILTIFRNILPSEPKKEPMFPPIFTIFRNGKKMPLSYAPRDLEMIALLCNTVFCKVSFCGSTGREVRCGDPQGCKKRSTRCAGSGGRRRSSSGWSSASRTWTGARSSRTRSLIFFFFEEARPQVETEGMTLPQPPESAG